MTLPIKIRVNVSVSIIDFEREGTDQVIMDWVASEFDDCDEQVSWQLAKVITCVAEKFVRETEVILPDVVVQVSIRNALLQKEYEDKLKQKNKVKDD